MRKRVQIALAVVLVMLAGVITWQVLHASREREPVFQGKPLSVWLEAHYQQMMTSHPYVGPEEQANWNRQVETVEQAIRHIGTNALPVLIERLQVQDTRLKRLMMTWADKQKLIHFHFKPDYVRRQEAVLGYRALGSLASVQVPSLIEMLTHDPSPDFTFAAVSALGAIGPEARSAVPALLRATKDKDYRIRSAAFVALGNVRADPQLTIPVLVAGLDDPSLDGQYGAAVSLGVYGPEARAAVPALLCVQATNNGARMALKQIDPEAAAQAGVK